MRLILYIYLIFLFSTRLYAQGCNQISISKVSEINSVCSNMVMNMIHDNLSRPYLYVANKEGGLKIYNIKNLVNPSLVSSVSLADLGGLEVMALHQDSIFLFLALGNSFAGAKQAGGMAVINIQNPDNPTIVDTLTIPGSSSGCGIIVTEGNYAYLGMMQEGLSIVDISDKKDLKLASQYIPDINFPVNNPSKSLYNARGMVVKNAIVYLCYDAGGIRVLNCKNSSQPKETGRWCNPTMYIPINRPRAYNNCILNDSLLFVSVDYCGIEILNIKDTSHISLISWWNPYNCPSNNWFSSPSHVNELVYDSSCHRLFMSTGKSDMIVLDLTDPYKPDSCGGYGGINNNAGTWGISMWNNYIYLSYICAAVPFISTQTRVAILTYNSCSNNVVFHPYIDKLIGYPNPVIIGNNIYITEELSEIFLYDFTGKMVQYEHDRTNSEYIINTSGMEPGVYLLFIKIKTGEIIQKKWVVTN